MHSKNTLALNRFTLSHVKTAHKIPVHEHSLRYLSQGHAKLNWRKKHLSVFLPEEQLNKKKFGLASLAYHAW